MKEVESTRLRVPRRRPRFPGTAELERLILLDAAVIIALLILVICRR
jgi:hypothetical protein